MLKLQRKKIEHENTFCKFLVTRGAVVVNRKEVVVVFPGIEDIIVFV